MAEEIFQDFYRYFTKGKEIYEAFKKKGFKMYQCNAMVLLYQSDLPRQELKKLVGINNEAQFSSSVMMPLRQLGYIEKDKLSRKIKLTEKCKDLVEVVMKELGYVLENDARNLKIQE